MTNGERSQADREAAEGFARLTAMELDYTPKELDDDKDRVGQWLLWGAFGFAVFLMFILVLFLIMRNDPPPPAPEANVPAGPAQPGGNQPAGGGAAQPGGDQGGGGQQPAGGGAAQPGGGQAGGGDAGIVPANCRVPTTGFQVELSDLSWTVELASSPPVGAGDVSAGWDTGVRNLVTEPIAVYRHYSSHSTKEGAPNWKPIPPVDDNGTVNNAWDWSWTTAEPGVEPTESGYSSFSLLADPPPLCNYRVIDRLVVVYKRPECLDPIIARMKETQSDPTLREAFMNPLAIEGILPAQMANTTCP